MANHCRKLASTRHTDEASQLLLRMAETYDLQARENEAPRGAAAQAAIL
ncbi:MAG: hypothetical protein ABIQ32_08835 [Sphingomicrobium sp.]